MQSCLNSHLQHSHSNLLANHFIFALAQQFKCSFTKNAAVMFEFTQKTRVVSSNLYDIKDESLLANENVKRCLQLTYCRVPQFIGQLQFHVQLRCDRLIRIECENLGTTLLTTPVYKRYTVFVTHENTLKLVNSIFTNTTRRPICNDEHSFFSFKIFKQSRFYGIQRLHKVLWVWELKYTRIYHKIVASYFLWVLLNYLQSLISADIEAKVQGCLPHC